MEYGIAALVGAEPSFGDEGLWVVKVCCIVCYAPRLYRNSYLQGCEHLSTTERKEILVVAYSLRKTVSTDSSPSSGHRSQITTRDRGKDSQAFIDTCGKICHLL